MERTDFETAIQTLSTSWEILKQAHAVHVSEWQDVRLIKCQLGGHFLRITRKIPHQNSETSSSKTPHAYLEDEDPEDQHDEESLPKCSANSAQTIPVIHDVIYSPTYQVPVLYIHRPPSSHEILIELYAPSAKAVGVMGGMTLVEHPESGKPVYFVHPCRTQEAVRDVSGGESMKGLEWLMVWFGVIGSAVGLSVPVEVARAVSEIRARK